MAAAMVEVAMAEVEAEEDTGEEVVDLEEEEADEVVEEEEEVTDDIESSIYPVMAFGEWENRHRDALKVRKAQGFSKAKDEWKISHRADYIRHQVR